MADPATMSLLLSLGSAGAGALFGGEDEFKMSPRKKAIFDRLTAELAKGDLGISIEERQAMEKQLKEGIREESERATASSTASLVRRGGLSAGQQAGLTTSIQAGAGKAFGRGLTDIALFDAREKARRRSEIESTLLGTPEQFDTGDDIFDDLGGLSENIMSIILNRRKKPGVNDEESFSNLRAPRF